MPNYAEFQRRLDSAELTPYECWRHGRTHAAYSWACNPPPQFDEAQRAAYVRGWCGEPAE